MKSRLAVIVTLALAWLVPMSGIAFADFPPSETVQASPLQPLDLSSPRETYQSFAEQTARIDTLAGVYAFSRSLDNEQRLLAEVTTMAQLFDLSEVPATTRGEVTEESFTSLADVLLRVPLPEYEDVPDAAQAEDAGLVRWTFPGTEVTMEKLEEGDRAGGWVFSARTVELLPEWRDRVATRPVLVRDLGVTDWRTWGLQLTGHLIPAAVASTMSTDVGVVVLGTPLWKVITGMVVAALVIVCVVLWRRWIGRRGDPGSLASDVFALTTPLLLVVLTRLARLFMETQVNHSGLFAEVVLILTTAVIYIAWAWAFWILVRLVVSWIIATPAISEDSYDAHLLRLVSRVVSVLGVAGIVLVGANELGIPALGLLAGLGIGGLAVALAAQSTVENLIGGITLFADRPFKVGDFVAFGGEYGTVEVIGPRSTRIRKLDGTRLTVPNGEVAKSTLTNYTQRSHVMFLHILGVRYETTREQLEWLVRSLRDELSAHPMVLDDGELPRVTVAGFGSSSVDIEVRAYVDTTSFHEFMLAQHELLMIIYRMVDEAGTQIAFPSTTAYLAQDAGITGRPAHPTATADRPGTQGTVPTADAAAGSRTP